MSGTDIAALIHERAQNNALKVQGSRRALRLEKHVQIFSQALRQNLNTTELRAVQSFFLHHQTIDSSDQQLQADVEILNQAFREQEIALSGKDPKGLTMHSGPLNASIGVVLHVDHFDPDDEMLSDKGFAEDFTFGMDWHHRATPRAMGCPVKFWGTDVQSCHDRFSSDLLNLIPCPFLVIGGFCAWRGYTQAIAHCSKIINSYIDENVEVAYALEFKDSTRERLIRVAVKIDHPAHGFHHPKQAHATSLRFDLQCELVLYINGHRFSTDSYRKTILALPSGRKNWAPLEALWSYRRKEEERCLVLQEKDFNSSFFIWARAYLTPGVTNALLQEKRSIIEAITLKMSQKQSESGLVREEMRLVEKGSGLRLGLSKVVNPRTEGRVYLETEIHHFKIPIPFDPQDTDYIRHIKQLAVDIKVEFDPDFQRADILAEPSAKIHDAAYGLYVRFDYQVERNGMPVLTTSYSTPTKKMKSHIRLCQMNSLADVVRSMSSGYTKSQPHRLVISPKAEHRTAYTSCHEEGCGVCGAFAMDKYNMVTQDGIAVWVKLK